VTSFECRFKVSGRELRACATPGESFSVAGRNERLKETVTNNLVVLEKSFTYNVGTGYSKVGLKTESTD
jgi:hypothetical protein